MSKGTILYIGTFQLPDKCAAAHRVINIAKSLRDIGYNVVFFGAGEHVSLTEAKRAEGFGYYDVFNQQRGAHAREMFKIEHIKTFANRTKNLRAIIAYNYPSIALIRLNNFCKSKGIRLIGDCTEWFDGKERGLLAGAIKRCDTILRMRYVQKHIDGMITISKYLYNFYNSTVPSVRIPPTVDLSTGKYESIKDKNNKRLVFTYAGSPSASKESLDIVVDYFNKTQRDDVELWIVGITDKQYRTIYNNVPNNRNIFFLGRVDHETAINAVKYSDYVIIVRPDSRLTQAGFPTKFVEALSCGVPVIATNTSDLSTYLDGTRNGCIIDINHMHEALNEIANNKCQYIVDKHAFDYHLYTDEIADFLLTVGV